MTDKLTVKYHGEKVGTLSLTPDNRLCAFEYDRALMRESIDDRKLTGNPEAKVMEVSRS